MVNFINNNIVLFIALFTISAILLGYIIKRREGENTGKGDKYRNSLLFIEFIVLCFVFTTNIVDSSNSSRQQTKIANTADTINVTTREQYEENRLSGKFGFKTDEILSDSDRFFLNAGGSLIYDYIYLLKDIYSQKHLLTTSYGNIQQELIRLRIEDNKLLISVTAYDLQGNWVVDVLNNYWRRNPNYTGKFNYDETGFEIIDNAGRILLSIDIVAKNKINFQGYHIKPGYSLLLVFGERMTIMYLNQPINYAEVESTFADAQSFELFEYFGEDWLHKRKKKSK